MTVIVERHVRYDETFTIRITERYKGGAAAISHDHSPLHDVICMEGSPADIEIFHVNGETMVRIIRPKETT